MYKIQVIEIKELEDSYDVLVHVYKSEISDKNLVHIMTITISPKPSTDQQLDDAILSAINQGMRNYTDNRDKVLKNRPTIVLNYDEITKEVSIE